MSGGLAYVLDERGDFAERRCNRAGVDLETVPEADGELLRALIARHVELTGSPRGEWVLENWEQMLPKFVKIFPKEYKRVLGQREGQVTGRPMAVGAR
jgi:glutamate synthase domain-containing protein 3